MVDDATALEQADEALDLVDRNCVADANVHAPALFERAAAVNADQFAIGIEEWAAGVTRVNGSVRLKAVGIFEQSARWELIAVDAGEDAVGDGRFEVFGEQKRIADNVHPLADAAGIAVSDFGDWEIVFADEFD